MNDSRMEVNGWIHKLDQTSVDYEARWGVGFLEGCASPELREKWERQIERLRVAVNNTDVRLVIDLVKGCIRGWEALEQYAIESGHGQRDAEYWEARTPDGYIIRVCKNDRDASLAREKDVSVYTLKEIACMIERNYKEVFEIKKIFPESKLDKIYKSTNEIIDDDIPF